MARNDVTITIDVSGVPQAIRKLGWTPKEAQQLAVPMLKVARTMLNDARTRVPVQTGNLRASGKIKGASSIQFGYGVEVTLEYGGGPSKEAPFPDPAALPASGKVDYAEQVHEVTARSGELKWLENAAKAHLHELEPALKAAVLQIMAKR